MKLYSYWRSTTSYRVRAALNLKGVAYDIVPVDLTTGAQQDATYLALNPGAGVPTLVLDDGAVLTQSLAILEYIDSTWPEPPLLPADPLARARAQAAAHTIALDIHPVNNLRVAKHLKSAYGADDMGAKAWMQHWMIEGFGALEALLPDGDSFAFGATPGLVDLCVISQLYNAHRWGVDLAPYPKIRRIEAACADIPEITAAHPDNQPDAKVTT